MEASCPIKKCNSHIHGSNDLIFPTKFLKDYIELPKGDHAMILKRADWINNKIPKIIMEN